MRSMMCGLLTRIATIVGSLTLLAFVLMTVTLDPGRPARVLHGLVTSDAGKDVAAQVLASQVLRYDPNLTHAQAAALSQRVVADPRLPQALAVAENGDPSAAVNAVLASVRRYDPAAAAAISKHLPHTATGEPAVQLVPSSVGTTLFRAHDDLSDAVLIGTLIAIAAAVGALLLGPRRDRVLRRLGWWCIGASAFQVALWVGVPRLLDRLHGQWPALAAIAVRAAGSTVAGTFVTLLVSGTALLAAGYFGHLLRPPARSATNGYATAQPTRGSHRATARPEAPPGGQGPAYPGPTYTSPSYPEPTYGAPSRGVYRGDSDPDDQTRSWTV